MSLAVVVLHCSEVIEENLIFAGRILLKHLLYNHPPDEISELEIT